VVGARLLAAMLAEHAAFQLGDGEWCGYWYGVIPEVVGGVGTGFDYRHLKKVSLPGTAKRK
jgi:hypothetical protein